MRGKIFNILDIDFSQKLLDLNNGVFNILGFGSQGLEKSGIAQLRAEIVKVKVEQPWLYEWFKEIFNNIGNILNPRVNSDAVVTSGGRIIEKAYCQYTGVMICPGYLISDLLFVTRYDYRHLVFICRNTFGSRINHLTAHAVITERFHFLNYVGCPCTDSYHSETNREWLLVFFKYF